MARTYVIIEQEDPGFGTVRTYLGVTWRYVCWRHVVLRWRRHLALRGRHLASHGVTWHYVELRWPEVYLTSHVCWDAQCLDICASRRDHFQTWLAQVSSRDY